MTRWCLDSWAVLRWLEGIEPAATRVDEVIATKPVMSWINLGEVYYITARASGHAVARGVVEDLRRSLDLDVATPDRVMEAAALKADHAMALADAFAVAAARAHGATLLTGDPEIDRCGCRLGGRGPPRLTDVSPAPMGSERYPDTGPRGTSPRDATPAGCASPFRTPEAIPACRHICRPAST